MFKSAATQIYADFNATAPLRPQARDAMNAAMENGANPSSVHTLGRRAKAQLESARDQVAMSIGACRDDVAFTSGGTEANAGVIHGARAAEPALKPIISSIEHSAVMEQCPDAEIASVDADGVFDLNWLEARLKRWSKDEGIPFLSLMLANNETGVIQPVAEAARLVKGFGGRVHTDAVQGLGKINVSVVDLEVDYLTLSAHKVGGPQGVGAFYIAPGAPFRAQLVGGGQERGRRCGTENVIGIAGFGAACEAAVADLSRFSDLETHRERMESRLKSEFGVVVFGENALRLSNTTCLGVEGFSSETQVMAMDLAGVAVSAGSACSSGKVRKSHVLGAMGVSDDLANGALRISMGWRSTPEDYDKIADAWIAAATRAGVQSVSHKETA